jgi:hypothetical protein
MAAADHGRLEPGVLLVDTAWKAYLEITGDAAGVTAFHAAMAALADHFAHLPPADVRAEARRVMRECEEYRFVLRAEPSREERGGN